MTTCPRSLLVGGWVVDTERSSNLGDFHVVERGDERTTTDSTGGGDQFDERPQPLDAFVLGRYDPWCLVRF